MNTRAVEQRIFLLSEKVVKQIAAGEVVTRPASILKELLENSIDAQARHIQVWTQEGGKRLIQVSDNGIGMSPIDAELCFERHATSKITSLKDLYQLQTKGFRGEALASIAAVAHVELFTRRPEDELGTHVVMAFGEKRLSEPTRCAPGTTLLVTRLFQQLPVRLKSLRAALTEHRHNLQEFFRVAYPHSHLAFTYYYEEERLYDLPPQNLLDRILALNPALSPADLTYVAEETPIFRIEGYLVLPEKLPAESAESYLFINQRYIRHPSLHSAIWQVYKPLVGKERKPLYWLFLEVPPTEVDINVVPSKTEARLVHELEIRKMLMSIVQKGLAQSYIIPSPERLQPSLLLPDIGGSAAARQVPLQLSALEAPLPFATTMSALTPPEANPALLLYRRYLIVAEQAEGAWVVDLWRAYERLSYERLRRQPPIPRQGLLIPLHETVSPPVYATLQAWATQLNSYGVTLDFRDAGEIVLHAVPATQLPGLDKLLLESLIAWAEAGPEAPADWGQTLAQITMQQLQRRPPRQFYLEEALALYEALSHCENPNYTPGGYPIRFFLSREALSTLFG